MIKVSVITNKCKVILFNLPSVLYGLEGRRGCDHMVIGFTTTYAISAYYH
jgi:hypothetical protein